MPTPDRHPSPTPRPARPLPATGSGEESRWALALALGLVLAAGPVCAAAGAVGGEKPIEARSEAGRGEREERDDRHDGDGAREEGEAKSATVEEPARSAERAASREEGELAPGEIRIERSPPGPEEIAHRRRLTAWRPLYERHLEPLRRAHAALAAALESSSLSASRGHCRELLRRALEVDLEVLHPAPDARLDRALFGALARYRAGGELCLEHRYLRAHRLLEEGRTGLQRIDRYLDHRLREPVRLEGLE